MAVSCDSATPEKLGQAANFRAGDVRMVKRLEARKFEACPCFSGLLFLLLTGDMQDHLTLAETLLR